MHVKKLRLSGFKSFVRPAELLIEPGLTGIVGPNGCGKSNLVEALRWVMGESSARGLRGGEMEDVIFAGTAGRPAYDLAEVSLQLQGGGERIAGIGEDDELELVRRIVRGSGSSFRLNGRELRARDVQLLFADASAGARSAAIVGQGQIGALVEAKPQDRRRLLEEAAGVAGLQARRHEAELKLRAAEANLVRLEDLLQTLQEQQDQLKKQARQARRYGEIGARLREVEARLALGRWLAAAAELQATQDRLSAARTRALEANGEHDRLRQERLRLTSELDACREAAAAARTERARLAERLQAFEAAEQERHARLERSRAQVDQLERDRVDAGTLLDDARAADARLEREQAELRAAIEDGTAEEQEAASAVERLAAEVDAAGRAHRAALARHGELEAAHRHGLEERSRLEQERDALVVRMSELRRQDPAGTDGGVDHQVRLAAAEDALQRAAADCLEAERAAEEREHEREAAREVLRRAAERLRLADQAVRDAEQVAARERQARDALVARRDDLGRRLERLTGRRAELELRRSERRAAKNALALDRLEQERAGAVEARAGAEAADAAARIALAEAKDQLATSDTAARELTGEVDRLEVEAAALATLDGGSGHPAVLERIEVPEHLADAVAAGLGDDLLASLDAAAEVRWGGAASAATTSLPEPARPLAELIGAPDALHPRLRQIGLCDGADAARLQARLAPGQRLVSPEGGLWRWDGFIRSADALQSVGARLRQSQRRRELEAGLEPLRGRLEDALVAQQSAAAAVAAAEADLAALSEAAGLAAARLEAAERELAAAQGAERSLAVELGNLDESLAQIDDEAAEVGAELAEVTATLEAADDRLPEADDGPGPERDAADAEHRQAFAAERMALEQLEQVRARLADRRAALERCREEAERARDAARAAEVEERERRHALERHQAERERLEAAQAALEARLAELDRRARALEEERGAAAGRLAAAEAGLSELERTQAAALAERSAVAARRQAGEQRLAQLDHERALWAGRQAEAESRLADVETRAAAARDELGALQASAAGERSGEPLRLELAALDRRLTDAETAVGEADQALASVVQGLEAADGSRSELRERVVRLEAEVERFEAALAEAEARLRARPLPKDLVVDDEVPEPAALAALDEERAKLEAARERLGAVNLRAVDELRELELRLETLTAERDELHEAIERLRRAINALNREGRERLKVAFAEIEKHFEALFSRLFGGGHARLSLTDLEDPLAAGLELAASPPGKKLQSLSLLSGGEKALTALALIFAVFLARPSPLCILDEVDAPLDDANVERLAALLDELASGTQTRFVVVTHHPLTMAHMDRLYGVTMLERGVSELVSVDLGRAIELRQTA